MKNSKLIRLLSTFDLADWKHFEDFIKSPFFNKRHDVTVFFQYLRPFAPKFNHENFIKDDIIRGLKNLGLEINAKQLNYLMNYLLDLTEKFISVKELEKNPTQMNYYQLSYFSEKKLQKHFQHKYKKNKIELDRVGSENSNFHLNQYLLSNLNAEEFAGRQIRVFNNHFQEAANQLDEFYFIRKIKLSLLMLTQLILFPGQYEMNFLEEIKSYLQNKPNISPELQIYFQTYKMLSNEDIEKHFHDSKLLLDKLINTIPSSVLKDAYLHNINYCLRKIRAGNSVYIGEALNLYIDGIENKILLENGYLSPWTYTNITKLALRLQKYDWIKDFIFKYKDKIHESFRENAFSYTLSELYFHSKNYELALEELNKVKFSDMIYLIGSRVILIKIYYEKDESDSLLSLIASFSMFLKRNKKISKNLKAPYLNFCEFLHLILRSPIRKKEKIKSKIEKEPILNDKAWLLNVLEKEMN